MWLICTHYRSVLAGGVKQIANAIRVPAFRETPGLSCRKLLSKTFVENFSRWQQGSTKVCDKSFRRKTRIACQAGRRLRLCRVPRPLLLRYCDRKLDSSPEMEAKLTLPKLPCCLIATLAAL